MNLTKLKWTKNVNHQDDKSWAYQDIEPNLKIFLLGWKNENPNNTNARKPPEGELILLRQRTKVTHIVKILNNTLYDDRTNSPFNTCRLVEAVWMVDNWDTSLAQNIVFDYSVHLQGGEVMQLETPKFRENWDERGGLQAFQKHVQKVLNLDTKELSGLQELNEIGESDCTD